MNRWNSNNLGTLFAWPVSVLIASLLRFDGDIPANVASSLLILCLVLVIIQVLLNFFVYLWVGVFRPASLESAIVTVLKCLASACAGYLLIAVSFAGTIPRSIPLIAFPIASFLILSLSGIREAVSRKKRRQGTGKPTLIIGAGQVGEHLARLMLSDDGSPFQPVGFIDDDPRKARLKLHGVRVRGRMSMLAEIAVQTSAEVVILAISNLDSTRFREIAEIAQELRVEFRAIPGSSNWEGLASELATIPSVTINEILGRRPVRTDEVGIRGLIEGKRILITGAGGSIGSEIARQVHHYNPERLMLLDRDESALLATHISIIGDGLLQSEDVLLADIRDDERVSALINRNKPQIVFHAAALKHLTLLEMYPLEAWKTNVLGTQNLFVASEAAGVELFVNISTDKAADPISALGKSKLATEKLMASDGRGLHCRALSVRFGNVLGSRGSVIHTFRSQIQEQGKVSITHPDVTRYFMTISEAVHLVLQAAVLGESGETLILDMGDPIRIVEVAERLIAEASRNVEIEYVGLREGEKLHETLVGQSEILRKTSHSQIGAISRARSPFEILGNPATDEEAMRALDQLTM